jgi:hypothetical protein
VVLVPEDTLTRSAERYARALLATTCLTLASTHGAMASTITEGVPPAPDDFPNSPNGYALPTGTDTVIGQLGLQLPNEGGIDTQDWFEFSGLTAGANYVLTANYYLFNAESGVRASLYTDGGSFIGTGSLEAFFGGAVFNGTVPGDGKLVVDVYLIERDEASAFVPSFVPAIQTPSQESPAYIVQLSTAPSGVPEPATFGGVGLALTAGAVAWNRKRKK